MSCSRIGAKDQKIRCPTKHKERCTSPLGIDALKVRLQLVEEQVKRGDHLRNLIHFPEKHLEVPQLR